MDFFAFILLTIRLYGIDMYIAVMDITSQGGSYVHMCNPTLFNYY